MLYRTISDSVIHTATRLYEELESHTATLASLASTRAAASSTSLTNSIVKYQHDLEVFKRNKFQELAATLPLCRTAAGGGNEPKLHEAMNAIETDRKFGISAVVAAIERFNAVCMELAATVAPPVLPAAGAGGPTRYGECTLPVNKEKPVWNPGDFAEDYAGKVLVVPGVDVLNLLVTRFPVVVVLCYQLRSDGGMPDSARIVPGFARAARSASSSSTVFAFCDVTPEPGRAPSAFASNWPAGVCSVQLFKDGVVVPSASPEAVYKASREEAPRMGYLRHDDTGSFVLPKGGEGKPNSRLILRSASREPRFRFQLHPDGSLQHVASGLFVHPEGTAKEFAFLILRPEGHEGRLAFQFTSDGQLVHVESRLPVRPCIMEESDLTLAATLSRPSSLFSLLPL